MKNLIKNSRLPEVIKVIINKNKKYFKNYYLYFYFIYFSYIFISLRMKFVACNLQLNVSYSSLKAQLQH